MSFSGQIYPDDTVAYFRIASATERQPIEPIAIGEFYIGTAENCQLRLGDDSIPAIHSMLQVEAGRVRVKCKADPPLLVNGSSATDVELLDGDLVEIGEHRLLFRMVGAEGRITLDETAFTDSEVPTEELVNRLEEQLSLIEELSVSNDEPIIDLLNAVARSAVSTTPAVAPEATTSPELEQVTRLLEKQHEASRIRLESLTSVLNNVVKQQKLIADTLEVLSNRVQALDTTGVSQRRAS